MRSAKRDRGVLWGRAVAAVLCLLGFESMCLPARAASTTLVVNEVMLGDAHANSDEFVEVRNISNEDLHVDRYTLRYQSTKSDGTPSSTVKTFYTFPVGSIIPAGGYWLVVSNTYAANAAHKDQPYNGTFVSEYAGTINANGAVGLFDASGSRVDSVGWGSVPANHPLVETAAAPFFSSGQTIERITGEGGMSADTDDNSLDFAVTLSPTPTSTPYVPKVPVVSASAAPDRIERGASFDLVATVTPTANPVASVTVDLSPLSGSAEAPLANTSGTTWKRTITVPADQVAGPVSLVVRATDAQGGYGAAAADLFIFPGPPLSVAEMRQRTPNTGEVLRLHGLVLTTRTGNAYLIDAAGGAALSVADATPMDGTAALEAGQDVTITGQLVQDIWTNDSGAVIYRDEYVFQTATGTLQDIVVNSSGNALPAPKAATLNDITADDSLLGQYVTVTDVTATGPGAKVNSVTGTGISQVPIAVPTGHAYVAISRNATDQAMAPYPGVPVKPIPGAINQGFLVPWPANGDTFDVRGIVGSSSLYLGSKVLRVSDATDFVLTNNAKFISGAATPSPVEQGRTARLRVVGYPVDVAAVTVDASGLGAGTVTLSSDGRGGYAVTVSVPASAPLGDVALPVTVRYAGKTATGSFTVTVAAPTSRPGDVDNSGGTPTVADAALALRVAGGLTSGADPAVRVDNGDVFPKGAPDGRLTPEDAARILRAVQGLETL